MTPVPVSLSPPATIAALREQLAETRRVAEAAVEVRAGVWVVGRTSVDDATSVIEDDTFPVTQDVWSHQAHHIARHDPASVLRQVTAWDAVLDGVEATLAEHHAEDHPEGPWCPLCSYGYPCPDARRALSLLAAAATALGVEQ